jgi:hypothetical protein
MSQNDYLTSDEAIIETFVDIDFEFTSNGDRFKHQ